MQFRSSSVVIVLCAITLMAVVALRYTAPRMWGNVYVRSLPAQEEEQQGEVLIIADTGPEEATIHIGQPLQIENHIPRSIQVTFALFEEEVVAYETLPLVIGSSSQASIQFATSGIWKCQSGIIRACGTVHVQNAEAY